MHGRDTKDGDGRDTTSENVVRLPRDWLGPRDELVPMGSRARALDEARTENASPAASFWGEDSGSVQAPVTAPDNGWSTDQRSSGPGGAEAGTLPRLSALLALLRLRAPAWVAACLPRSRVAATVGAATACVLALLVVSGLLASGSGEHGHKAPSAGISAFRGVNTTPSQAQAPVVSQVTPQPRSHHAAAARVRRAEARHHTRAGTRHHTLGSHPKTRRAAPAIEAVRTTTPSSAPAPATTPATTEPPTSTPTTSAPSSTSASSSSGGGHHAAFGPSGGLGPGSSPDG